jgi:hypothetical protein
MIALPCSEKNHLYPVGEVAFFKVLPLASRALKIFCLQLHPAHPPHRALHVHERDSAKPARHPEATAVAAERSKSAFAYEGRSSCCWSGSLHEHQAFIITHSTLGKLFQEIIGKPIPEPPPKLPSQISVRNVARFDLEETMTEGSDAAADYSSDGSEDRCAVAALRWYFLLNLCMQYCAAEAAVQSCHE